MMKAVVLLLSLAVACLHASLTFPDQYFLSGVFSIPYFNITEPIALWYDAVNNREVFSYYNGVDTYYTFGDQNVTYAITPEVDTLVCTKATGDAGALVSLLVDVDGWENAGLAYVDFVRTTDYRLTMVNFTRGAQYDFYVANATTAVPIKLVLNGVDFVFDSHPDVYIMDYDTFLPGYVDEDIFGVPEICNNAREIPMEEMRMGLATRAFAALKDSQDYPTHSLSAEERQFQEFAVKYGKKYSGKEEYSKRFDIFQDTLKFIQAHNADSTQTFTVAINHFADLTNEEFKATFLPRKGRHASNAQFTHTPSVETKTLPKTVDWREKGVVNPVKDQGVCGSCYSFGSTGSLEGVYAIKTGSLVSLSEQQILDCSWPHGNNGCDGGEASFVYDWLIQNGGIALEQQYPYLMQDGFCQAALHSDVRIKAYVNVTEGEPSLQDAVATVGPVAIAIDASVPSFRYYNGGVYYTPECQNGLDDLDHEVLAVGYGTYNGSDYWLVKNSWSTWWGIEGYTMMARNRDNACGVATQPNYPIV